MEHTNIFYENLTPADFRQRLAHAPIAYVPLGTLEWHGEHLPLGADGLQARGFFARMAQEVGGIVLPMLYLGPDRRTEINGKELVGMEYDVTTQPAQQLDGGAYWVSDELFKQMLDGIVKQLARAGFRIIVAHGHGPSTAAFRRDMPALQEKYGVVCHHCWLHDADSNLGLMIDHAAANETSITMALYPELVHMQRAPQDLHTPLLGVGGADPRTHASPEHGEVCMHNIGARLKTLLHADLLRLGISSNNEKL